MSYGAARAYTLLACFAGFSFALAHRGIAGWAAALGCAVAGLTVWRHHRWGPFLVLVASFLAYEGANVVVSLAMVIGTLMLLAAAGKG